MRKFLLVALALLSTACSTLCPKDPPPEPVFATVIGSANPDGSLKIGGLSLNSKFEDGTKLEKAYTERDLKTGTYFLYRLGHTDKKDCLLSRTKLDIVDAMVSVDMRAQGTETCTGQGCENCAFKDGGGCICKSSTSTCNHTISRNRVIFE